MSNAAEAKSTPEDPTADKLAPGPDHDPLAPFRNNPIFHELDPPPSPPPEPPVPENQPVLKKLQLTSHPTAEEIDYFMDHYDYDPNDDVVNNFNEVEAENFIRTKVIEYRNKHGLPI